MVHSFLGVFLLQTFPILKAVGLHRTSPRIRLYGLLADMQPKRLRQHLAVEMFSASSSLQKKELRMLALSTSLKVVELLLLKVIRMRLEVGKGMAYIENEDC